MLWFLWGHLKRGNWVSIRWDGRVIGGMVGLVTRAAGEWVLCWQGTEYWLSLHAEPVL